MTKEILYTVIIYKEEQRLEIYKKEFLQFNNYYNNDNEMYHIILHETRDCHDANKINIIYK